MKHFILAGCAVILAAAFTGCSTTDGKFESRVANWSGTTNFTVVPQAPDASLLHPSNQAFTLGPGDRIDVEMWVQGSPPLRQPTVVGPDGKIYFNLLAGLDVWGLNLAQTRDLLEQEMGKLVNSPRITVSLREVSSKQVWVLGRLNKPGIYPIASPMTLLEAVSLAGGTARSQSIVNSVDLADLRHSFVVRNGQPLPVDFYKLLKEGDISQNIYLQPDDFVFVPSTTEQEVYVLGAVRLPRAIPYLEGMSLASALAGSAGQSRYNWFELSDPGPFVKDANLRHVAIIRGSISEPRIAIVNASAILGGSAQDVLLEPGDIVYVPNSPYTTLKRYLNMALSTFVTTVSANEGIRAAGGEVGVGVTVPVGR